MVYNHNKSGTGFSLFFPPFYFERIIIIIRLFLFYFFLRTYVRCICTRTHIVGVRKSLLCLNVAPCQRWFEFFSNHFCQATGRFFTQRWDAAALQHSADRVSFDSDDYVVMRFSFLFFSASIFKNFILFFFFEIKTRFESVSECPHIVE